MAPTGKEWSGSIRAIPQNHCKVARVSLLGQGQLRFQQTEAGLSVQLPTEPPCEEAFVLRLQGAIV
jgi:alpha-L-fucosidase